MGATKISSVAVQFEATGLENVREAFRQIEGQAKGHSSNIASHYGRAARHIAIVGDEAVRAGEIGGSGMRKLLTVGGDIAGMFGPEGMIIGALAVTGLAIFDHFQHARDQIAETAKKAREEIGSLVDAGDAAALEKQAKDLYRGTPKNEFKDALKPKLDKMEELKYYRSALGEGKVWLSVGAKKAYDELLADPDIQKYLALREAILNPKKAPLQGAGQLQDVKVEGPKKATDAELSNQIDTLTKGLIFEDLRAKSLTALRQLEIRLTAAVKDGTKSIEARSLAADHLATVQTALARTYSGISSLSTSPPPGVSITPETATRDELNKLRNAPMANVSARPDNLIQDQQAAMATFMQQFKAAEDAIAQTIKRGFAQTLGDAIYAGFSAAFTGKGLGGIFKSFAKTVLAGVGQIFTQLGQTYLEYGGIMQALAGLLPNPFTAGYAGLAIGAALVAMGAALGAVATGGSHSSASVIPRPSEITNIKLTATSVADQARYDTQSRINMTVIGPNDAAAFRAIQQGLDNHARR